MRKDQCGLLRFPISTLPNSARARSAVILALGLTAGEMLAATLSWSGAGTTGNWSESANWGYAGVPATGDTLIFSSGQPRTANTNNLAGLVLNQVQFLGPAGGYTLYGNAFTLTNGILANNTVGTNTVYNSITVASADNPITVAASAGLVLNGVLSGTVGVTKSGGGILTYQGPSSNPYSGTTRVNAGILHLNVGGYSAFGGPLIIGDGSGTGSPIVRNLQFQEISESIPITINKNGLLDLNGYNELIGNSLTLNEGKVQTLAGLLTLADNSTIAVSGNSQINGNMNLGTGTLTIQGSGFLFLDPVLSGSANVVKNGSVNVGLGSANSFTGNFTANGSGWLWAHNSLSFGATNGGVTINDSVWLAISQNINITNKALTLNSPGYTVMVYDSSSNSWSGTFTNNATAVLDINTNCALNLIGTIYGSGGLTKLSPGTLVLGGTVNNEYQGDTILNDGLMLLDKLNCIRHGQFIIGDGWGGASTDIVRYRAPYGIHSDATVRVNSSGWLDLNGYSDDLGSLILDGGRVTTGTGTMLMYEDVAAWHSDVTNGPSSISGRMDLAGTRVFLVTNNTSLTVSAAVSGDGLTKDGDGSLYLIQSNSYSGLTVVRKGILWVQNSFGLGLPVAGTVVSNRASLVLSGGIGVTNESLILNGPGVSSIWGALDAENSGTNVWTGPVTLNADSTITPYGSSTYLQILGPIDGPGGVTIFANASGILWFGGNVTNSYGGMTSVDGGELWLKNSLAAPQPGVPGPLDIGTRVLALQDNAINYSSDVNIRSTGRLDCNGYTDYFNALTGSGHLDLGPGGWLVVGRIGASSTFDGLISGAGDFYKDGSGTITLTANNILTGRTHAWTGTLVVNGSQPASDVDNYGGPVGTLAGTGVVGQLDLTGNLRPGSSPGRLTCSNLTFSSSAHFYVDLTGPAAGLDYDQVLVRGTNNLGGASLVLNPAFTKPVTIGQQFAIIDNDGSDPITGTFSGLPEGATISLPGYSFRISYTGGTGNDVVLTLTSLPAASGTVAVSTGNGNHLIDPNECNQLAIVISNQTSVPMTGISAVLSSTMKPVMVSQPASVYPDIPPGGQAANVTAFQISTLPELVCGADVSLQLTVITASHGIFNLPIVLHTGEPGVTPTRFDNNVAQAIPDIGSINSTNVVSGFSARLAKVVVSLFITHTWDADLSLALKSPDGTTVDLSSGNGAGANFGIGLSPDSNRTTFDDAAATPITAGAPPFVGSFRPEGSLAVYSGMLGPNVNGDWVLTITDSAGGTLGTLRGWSLLLYPVACAPGGGACDTCIPSVAGTIDGSSPVQTGRLFRGGSQSTCGTSNTCPGLYSGDANPRHYNTHSFTNTSPTPLCVNVRLETGCDLFAVAYLDSFDPTDLCANYLGDSGSSSAYGAYSNLVFSCTVPPAARLVVAVHEMTNNSTCGAYTLYVAGLPCPPPMLVATPASLPNNVRIDWPTWAGGYNLEAKPLLNSGAYNPVPEEPVVTGGRYAVTNIDTTPPTRFYRLNKPL